MGVIIEDIRIGDEFTTSTTNYLLDNVGEKITIEIDFRAEELFVTEAEADVDRILLNPQPFRVNVSNVSDIVYCELNGVFENFKVGDNVKWYDSVSLTFSSNLTIYEKLSDQAFRVHSVGGAPGDIDFTASGVDFPFPINSYIFLTTDLTSIIYRYNFVGNLDADTYISKIDNQLNQLKAGGVDNTDTVTQVPLIFDAPKTNEIGSAYVKGNGSTTTAQKFTVVHTTILTPFILAGDLFDLTDGIAPVWFEADNALKSIFSIDVGRNVNDPNFIETVDYAFLDGNSGWFGENFNGGATNYSIESTTYKRLDTSVIDSVELVTAEQTVEIVVKNTIDDPFLAGSTEFALNFSIIPTTEADYTLNGKTVIENFYFDRAFTTNGTPVAGDNLGTDYTIIKSVDAVVNDAETMTITATLELSANGVADLLDRSDIEYFFWVSTQNHTLDREAADRVALVASIEPFYIDLTDDGLIGWSTKFLRHYESDFVTEGTENLIARTEDDVVGYTQFTIDRLGRETDEILITSTEIDLIAKKADGSEFNLESYSQSFSGSLIVGDTQYVDNTIDRAFQMPTNEQRKQIVTNRRIDLDTTDLRYYEVKYPFLFRWEYWTALSGVNSDAFDTTEDNNGYNEQWHRYDTLTDWDIYYRTTVNLTKNGEALRYQDDTLLETFTYNEDADWTTETIVALNADTLAPQGTLLVNPTRIKASKTYVGGSAPALADVEWVVRIEVYEKGGISDIRFLSSVYDWTENSWLSSVDTSNKVLKTVVGSIYSAEFLVDMDSLPEDATFKISARIYNEIALIPIPPDAKRMEDDTVKLMEDGTIKLIE
jgi:hypothetical protein